MPLTSLISAGENSIAAGKNQGLYFVITLASSLTAGTYAGQGVLTLDETTFVVPFQIKVMDLSMIQITIDRLSDGQKAEKFVKKYLSDAPLGFIYKAFRKKDIKRNGHWIPKDAILHQGDELRIYVTDQQLADFKKPREAQKKPFPYQIVYEDSNVIIVNKPKGLLVYGDDKGVRATLGNAILDYLYFKGEYDPHNAAFTPSPAHRLDRNTSGLVVYGKTDAALKELTDLFKERTEIEKRYLALVVGKVEHANRQ